jgi:alpha-ribazole phosphatase/probable phosphoglycerate mutase
MKTIILIRHAETAVAGRFCGHSDPALNIAGKMQLARVAHQAAVLGVQRIFSSDLRRASQTAQAISEQTGAPVELRPSLREIHFGLWEGLSWAEIEASFPGEAQAWVDEFPSRSAPEGESHLNFAQRIDSEFSALFRSNTEQVTAIVTHRGVMRHVLTRFFGRSEGEAFEQTALYGAVITVACRQVVEEATL